MYRDINTFKLQMRTDADAKIDADYELGTVTRSTGNKINNNKSKHKQKQRTENNQKHKKQHN
jgi:hypothetical protein